jgi:hypothetical protein
MTLESSQETAIVPQAYTRDMPCFLHAGIVRGGRMLNQE